VIFAEAISNPVVAGKVTTPEELIDMARVAEGPVLNSNAPVVSASTV
jgi:hypothetical protein